MTRVIAPILAFAWISAPLPSPTQTAGTRAPYLAWTAKQAEQIGKSTRTDGRLGGLFDLRVVHTEHSYNYKLRATWMTTDVIQATARLLQLSDRLTDAETENLVREATGAGDIVIMVEIDPREGSGVVPNGWTSFLGPTGNGREVAKGTNTPNLEKVSALRGVYRRDYNYELFWIVFSSKTADGSPLFPEGVRRADLTVRISNKEGRVTFAVPGR